MGNIVLLDDLTINKIAAGEVIERPSSVVKEMVENSIDAGASNITIEIRNGGISYIRITDNGKGIAEDDLEIAFERHATSKIRCAEDLNTVKSMGFRGEALASIAAIANVELLSKTANQTVGYRVVVEGGDVLSKEERACSTGTTITVKNLFFNTPVRYKFLKKDFTELGYIEDTITRIALVHPEISFKLINSGKTIIQTNGNGDLKTVIYSIYGKEISEKVLNVEYEYEGMKVSGVVGKSEIARSNRAYQMFFVNKRFVKDRTLSSASEQAFKGMLPIGKFAFLVLNLEIDSNKLDVNVHPAKLEVRFEEEQTVFKAVFHAIKDALLRDGLIEEKNINFNIEPDIKFSEQSSIEKLRNAIKDLQNTYLPSESNKLQDSFNTLEKLYDISNNTNSKQDNENQIIEEKAIEINERTDKIENDIIPIETEKVNIIEELFKEKNGLFKENVVENVVKEEPIKYELKDPIEKQENNNITDFVEMYKRTFGTDLIKAKEEIKEETKDIDLMNSNLSIFDRIEEYKRPKYKFVGIVFNTYIVLEINDEMYILDQHAAHERVMYEKIKSNYYTGVKNSQLLLIPDIITLSHKEMAIAKENMKMFENAGFIVEEFGENTIKLSGVPDICIDLETKEMFMETLDEINQVARTAKQEIEEKFISTVACKAAVKANMVLSKDEVDCLMNELLKLSNPFTCPHGRPTVIKMSKYDIERKFSRK